MKLYKRTITATVENNYTDLEGMDFKEAKAILIGDGFKEVEYGDTHNNGYAVYRKDDAEVELVYEWNQVAADSYTAGTVIAVYADTEEVVTASRRTR